MTVSSKMIQLESRPMRSWRRHKLIVIGGGLLSLAIACALLAPVLGTTDPTVFAPMDRLKPPSAVHWFGTDMVGRDVYSRVIYGARVSLVVGMSVAAISGILGLALGLLSGSVPRLDGLIMRFVDAMMAIPSVLLAIALMALWNRSLGSVVLAISLAEIPRTARLVRGTILSLREQPYIEASMSIGVFHLRIVLKHIVPNALPALMVQSSYVCASAMVVESILSFIGAGVPPTIPSWGNIMAGGRTLWLVQPLIIVFPAAFLSVTVLAVNLLGDGVRDLLDPRAGTH
ncbi:peptide/nickel transport system permease protein [Bradyrhizobium sp. USDA 4524]|uniref:ABC transporter permease n=1 Tax=unclassified Bradyrhizobium TaxID=2631580 RepID=UPI0035C67E3D